MNEANRVWQAIADGLLGHSQKLTHTGWISINCPMCVTRGETADRRHRCGIRNDGTIIGVHCFNCNFRAVYRFGLRLSHNMRSFLVGLGVAPREVALINLWAERLSRESGPIVNDAGQAGWTAPAYPVADLPTGSQSLAAWAEQECVDPWFARVADYLMRRGDAALGATTYYWTPTVLHRYVVIPCCHERRLVGWIARAADPTLTQRYLKELPSNYLFNMEFLIHSKRRYVFIVEGVFDALVLDAIGVLGASLNDYQIACINHCGKQPVVVPDRDVAGAQLTEIAIQQGWAVATPHFGRHQWWDAEIKDPADAVRRYGKLYTVQSVLSTMETSARQIRMKTRYHV